MTRLSYRRIGARLPRLSLMAALLATAACTSVGPSTQRVAKAGEAGKASVQGIQVIHLNEQMIAARPRPAMRDFATGLGSSQAVGETVGPGDVLTVSIWEAPPAVLFSSNPQMSSVDTSRATALPEFVVGQSGEISVPFAGMVPVAGRTLDAIERDITQRLRGKAHLPQVAVRLLRNQSANVSVVGDVNQSTRMPLTPKGERILDAIAASGGTKAASEKTAIQVSRDGQVYMMPMSAVIGDPSQNVVLRSGDIVTALYQPYSFTALGSASKSQELNFEATGITLAQAMGRIGGLQDGRADAKGVFLFRWEDPALVPDRGADVMPGPDGRIPVIYRVDMRDPGTYFVMQKFLIQDKDVLYISTNPVAEAQRVFSLFASTVLPLVAIDNAINR
ncbi:MULTISPECIES: polysaccharide biosynthesis/export family protein [Sphingobium]|jgi:polysaccharide biosynthesis/export protein|uniref:polysaccharide biosynthesis/export family protein n=1 Tax=Sphingobium TaxID=165695 RepID=UPI000C5F185F|nr:MULTISPECIES: polysaccharide biosynthesis/export family protein [Sphingobium]MAX16307.1 capsular biosynthesis protein [Sphingobium sp.]MEE2742246.1 polysaccharide biosynthesis/export family protein [Pseudomonadota bacterium]MBA37646.1 capsular biosynthesis protein [Sphingobium sp.]MBS47774.1 capsular biosynthesis protein [Sphingobium sp.]MCC4255757.1 polysaccharide export protein [Sphingobium lactosutens]|tara:strand:- start:6009 stop:7181 length:1173 start_codon:yes stop_codon:yes gene_type:complete